MNTNVGIVTKSVSVEPKHYMHKWLVKFIKRFVKQLKNSKAVGSMFDPISLHYDEVYKSRVWRRLVFTSVSFERYDATLCCIQAFHHRKESYAYNGINNGIGSDMSIHEV